MVQLGDLLEAYSRRLGVQAKESSRRQADVHAGHIARYFGSDVDAAALGRAGLDGCIAARLERVGRPSGVGC